MLWGYSGNSGQLSYTNHPKTHVSLDVVKRENNKFPNWSKHINVKVFNRKDFSRNNSCPELLVPGYPLTEFDYAYRTFTSMCL